MEEKYILAKIKPDCKQQIARNESIKEEMANESLLEKCWTEEYKGASRKWLIRDGSVYTPKKPLYSTMRGSYQYPNLHEERELEAKNIGKKREMLLKKFEEEAKTEILKQLEEPEEQLDYCTEYHGNFKADGFTPDDNYYKKNLDLNNKFPLYASSPISYYSFNQTECPNKKKEFLNGFTKVTDFRNIFRRNSQFSTPVSQSLFTYDL